MGIHYDYKSKIGERAMLKEAKRKARLAQKKYIFVFSNFAWTLISFFGFLYIVLAHFLNRTFVAIGKYYFDFLDK